MEINQQHNYPNNLMLALTDDELMQLYQNAHICNVTPQLLIKHFLKIPTTTDLPAPCEIHLHKL